MPDFTVIDGGGRGRPPDDYHRARAADAMRVLIVELLRAIARGNDPQGRVLKGVAELYDRLAETTGHSTIVDGVVAGFHSNLTTGETKHEYRYEIPDIIRAALQLAAEKSSNDEFTNSRTRERREKLHRMIESYICGLEEQSREEGGSYLKDFMKTHFRSKKSKPVPRTPPPDDAK